MGHTISSIKQSISELSSDNLHETENQDIQLLLSQSLLDPHLVKRYEDISKIEIETHPNLAKESCDIATHELALAFSLYQPERFKEKFEDLVNKLQSQIRSMSGGDEIFNKTRSGLQTMAKYYQSLLKVYLGKNQQSFPPEQIFTQEEKIIIQNVENIILQAEEHIQNQQQGEKVIVDNLDPYLSQELKNLGQEAAYYVADMVSDFTLKVILSERLEEQMERVIGRLLLMVLTKTRSISCALVAGLSIVYFQYLDQVKYTIAVRNAIIGTFDKIDRQKYQFFAKNIHEIQQQSNATDKLLLICKAFGSGVTSEQEIPYLAQYSQQYVIQKGLTNSILQIIQYLAKTQQGSDQVKVRAFRVLLSWLNYIGKSQLVDSNLDIALIQNSIQLAAERCNEQEKGGRVLLQFQKILVNRKITMMELQQDLEKDFWKPLSSLSFYDAIKQQAANSQFIISINQNVIGKINDYIENLDSRHTSFLKNYQRGLMCYCSSLAGEKEQVLLEYSTLLMRLVEKYMNNLVAQIVNEDLHQVILEYFLYLQGLQLDIEHICILTENLLRFTSEIDSFLKSDNITTENAFFLQDLQMQVMLVLGHCIKLLIKGNFTQSKLEESTEGFLKNPLVKYGISDQYFQNQQFDLPMGLLGLCQTQSLVRYQSTIHTNAPHEALTDQPATIPEYLERLYEPKKNEITYNAFFELMLTSSLDEKWQELIKFSSIPSINLAVGGNALAQAERALFAVYCILFNVTNTVKDLLQNNTPASQGIKLLVKEAVEIRRWASNKRQNLQDEDISYEELNQYIIQVCKAIVHSNFSKGLSELGLDESLHVIQKSIMQVSSPEKKKSQKWESVQNAMQTVKKLKQLKSISDINSPQSTLKQSFDKVNKIVFQLFDEPISFQFIETIKFRRIRALARAAAYMIFTLSLQNPHPILIRALSEGLWLPSGKMYYNSNIEGVDSYLQSVVQRSFYRMYNVLQTQIQENSEQVRDLEFYDFYAIVVEGLAYPFRKEDSSMLVECQILQTLSHLLGMARGRIGGSESLKYFDYNQCITTLQLKLGNKVDIGKPHALVLSEGGQEICVEFQYGQKFKDPITDIKVSNEAEPGWEVTSLLNNGAQAYYLLVKRASPKTNTRFLIDIQGQFELQWLEMNKLLKVPTAESRKKFVNLRKMSWLLFKLLVLVSVGRPEENDSYMQENLQEQLLSLLESDLQWHEELSFPVQKQTDLMDYAAGESWLKDTIQLGSSKKNPMQEFVMQLKTLLPGDSVIKDQIQDYISKYDSSFKGVLTQEMLMVLDEEKQQRLLEIGDIFNERQEVDFFRYLNAAKSFLQEACDDAGKLFLQTSPLFRSIPKDYYEASEEYKINEVQPVLNCIKNRYLSDLTPNANQLISYFDLQESPGLVPKDFVEGANIPQEFFNQNGQLDLYCTLYSIKSNPRKFPDLNQELQTLFLKYREMPSSILSLGSFQAQSADSLGPLLWSIFNTLGSKSMIRVLSRRLSMILQHMYQSAQFSSSLIAIRLLLQIIPDQHSPESIALMWDEINLNYLKLPLSEDAKASFIDSLIGIIGFREFWMNSQLQIKELEQWKYEGLNLLRALSCNKRWQKEIMDRVLFHISELKHSLQTESQPKDVQYGAISLLMADCQNATYVAHLDLQWALVKLSGVALSQGIIHYMADKQFVIYSVEDDSNLIVESKDIQDFIFSSESQFLESLDDAQCNALYQTLIDLVKSIKNATCLYSDDPRWCISQAGFMKITTLCAIKSIQYLSEKFDFDIGSLIDFLSSEIFPFISVRNLQFNPKILTKLERVLIISMTEIENPNQAQDLLTEDEASARIAKMNEEDQILAAELASFDIPLGRIIRAFEFGYKDCDSVLTWITGAMDQSDPLYRSSDRSIVPQHFSKLEDAVGYTNGHGHIIIRTSTSPKQEIKLTLKLKNNIFNAMAYLVDCITVNILLSSDSDFAIFGVDLGTFRIGIIQDSSEAQLYVQNELRAIISRQPEYWIRVYAQINGIVQVEIPEQTDRIEGKSNDLYCGGRLKSFDLWLQEGTKVVLKDLNIYSGKYSSSANFNDLQIASGRNLLTIPDRPTYQQSSILRLAGYQNTKEILSQNPDIEQLLRSNQVSQEADYELDNMRPIVDIKLIDSVDQMPDGWEVAQLMQGNQQSPFLYPGKRVIIFKRNENLHQPHIYVKHLTFDAQTENAQLVGNVNLSGEELNLYKVMEQNNYHPMRNIFLISSNSFSSMELEPGYQLATNADQLVVSLGEEDSQVFLAFSNMIIVSGCPLTPFEPKADQNMQYGMQNVLDNDDNQITDDIFRNKSVPELLEMHQQQCEAGALESSGIILFNQMKRRPEHIDTIIFREKSYELITFLMSSKNNIQTVIEIIRSSSNPELMEQLLKFIRSCLILGSFRMDAKGIQSNLNSNLFTVIKESSQAAIEALDYLIEQEDQSQEVLTYLQKYCVLPLLTISQNLPEASYAKRAIYILCKCLQGQINSDVKLVLKLLSLQASEEYKFRNDRGVNVIQNSVLFAFIELMSLYSSDLTMGWFDELKEFFDYLSGFADKKSQLSRVILSYLGISQDSDGSVFSSRVKVTPTEIQQLSFPGADKLSVIVGGQSYCLGVYDDNNMQNEIFGKELPLPVKKLQKVDLHNVATQLRQMTWNLTEDRVIISPQVDDTFGQALIDQRLANKEIKLKFRIDSVTEAGFIQIGIINSQEQEEIYLYQNDGKYLTQSDEIVHQYHMEEQSLFTLDYNDRSCCMKLWHNDTEVVSQQLLRQSTYQIVVRIQNGANAVSLVDAEMAEYTQADLHRMEFKVKGSQACINYPKRGVNLMNLKWDDTLSNCFVSSNGKDVSISEPRGFAQVKQALIMKPVYLSFTQISQGTQIIKIMLKSKVQNIDLSTIEVKQNQAIGLLIDPQKNFLAGFVDGAQKFSKQQGQMYGKYLSIQSERASSFQLYSIEELEKQGYIPDYSIDLQSLQPLDLVINASYAISTKEQFESIIQYFPDSQHISERFQRLFKYFSNDTAEEFVRYLDELCMIRGLNQMELNHEEFLQEDRLIIQYKLVQVLSAEDKKDLYEFFKRFNHKAQSLMTLFDLDIKPGQSLSKTQKQLLQNRGYIFFTVKNQFLQNTLNQTNSNRGGSISIDRPMAAKHFDRGTVDIKGEYSIFGQIYRQTQQWPPESFRGSDRIFSVDYRGEGSIDAGGPYREAFSNMCEELQSRFLRLLIPTSNQVNDMGENRDCFMVNPVANTEDDLELFTFLGKLMGVAIRSKMSLSLTLAPIVWKRLLKSNLSIYDIKGFDEPCFQMLEILNNLELNGINSSNFDYAFDETFTALDSSGQRVELILNGANTKVTFDNATNYASLIERMRLEESQAQYTAIWNGMSAVVPVNQLNLFTWRELEWLVCGSPDIDIDLLKSKTEYQEFSAEDRVIRLFWEVMEEFTPKEKSLFLKFVWGRSKLPPDKNFRNMKITAWHVGDPDKYLPVAHTCFFTLDLPSYTNKNAMKEKLLYAVVNCKAIDLDGQAGQGWDE